jgi:quinol monooxygenase YgiN
MSVTAIVRLKARPGQRKLLLQAMAGPVAATREHPLCSSVEMMSAVEDSDEILLVEHWPSVADHQNFINGVIAAGGLDELMPLLAGEIDTLHYTSSRTDQLG